MAVGSCNDGAAHVVVGKVPAAGQRVNICLSASGLVTLLAQLLDAESVTTTSLLSDVASAHADMQVDLRHRRHQTERIRFRS